MNRARVIFVFFLIVSSPFFIKSRPSYNSTPEYSNIIISHDGMVIDIKSYEDFVVKQIEAVDQWFHEE